MPLTIRLVESNTVSTLLTPHPSTAITHACVSQSLLQLALMQLKFFHLYLWVCMLACVYY